MFTTNAHAQTATTSKKHAFTYDHVNKKIVGTDIAFQKAGIPGSALEAELNIRIETRPSYGFTVIPTVKKPAKQTYKGLTSELITEYVEVFGNEVQKAELAQMIDDNENYPAIKSWFLEYFRVGFTVEKAKREIASRKLRAKKVIVHKAVKAKIAKANAVVSEFPDVANF